MSPGSPPDQTKSSDLEVRTRRLRVLPAVCAILISVSLLFRGSGVLKGPFWAFIGVDVTLLVISLVALTKLKGRNAGA
jgi:hypothetical protein